MLPTLSQIHKSAALSNISIGFRNQAFIADRVFPHVPVGKQSDYFYKFLKGAWFRNEARPRGPGGRAARSGYQVGSDTYNCIERALAHPIPIENINNADAAIRPWATGVRFATNGVMLAKEVLVSALCMTHTNWTSSNDAEGGWAAGESNTFIADMLAAKETIRQLIGAYPNVLLMDSKTFMALKQEDSIIERIKYTGTQGKPADVTSQTLASLFELEEVLIGGSLYSDAEEVLAGTDFHAVDLWEKTATKGSALLFYRTPVPALDEPNAGYIMEWKGGQGQESRVVNQDIYRQVRYWWEDAEKQFVVEASENFDAKVCGADAGFLFYDTILN
jgi:hypothetical protein